MGYVCFRTIRDADGLEIGDAPLERRLV